MSIESAKQAELIKLYYSNLGDGYFLDALKSYSAGKGFGLGEIWCVFAKEFQPWEEEYFGESGVVYYFDYPAVEKNESLIVDDNVFYLYLKEASNKFLKRNPGSRFEVSSLLSVIKNKIDLN